MTKIYVLLDDISKSWWTLRSAVLHTMWVLRRRHREKKVVSSTLTSCCLLQSTTTSHTSSTKNRSRVSTCGHTDSYISDFYGVESMRRILHESNISTYTVDLFTELTSLQDSLSIYDEWDSNSDDLLSEWYFICDW